MQGKEKLTEAINEVVGHQIGGTLYIVESSCDGKEDLIEKLKNHILCGETGKDVVE